VNLNEKIETLEKEKQEEAEEEEEEGEEEEEVEEEEEEEDKTVNADEGNAVEDYSTYIEDLKKKIEEHKNGKKGFYSDKVIPINISL
jgi:hypothetical protein